MPGRPLALNALVGDFDGDRRADVLIANGGRNWCLSRGNELAFAPPICIADGTDISEVVYGYNSPYTLTQPVPLPTYFYTGDFNGDGCLDVAAMVERSGYWSFMSGLPSGLGRAEMSLGIELNMPSAVRIENILFADFTGDGRLDIIARTPDNGGFLLSNGRPASSDNDLLNGVITPWGGQIEIYYQEAKAIPGAIVESSLNFPIMPNKSNRRMVTTLRVGDGRGNQYSTSYGYFNGKILAGHANERKDLGFEWCQKTNIKTGIRTKTYFRQDNPDLAYRKWREEEYNGAGQLMLRMDNSWARTDTYFFGTHFVALTQQRISTYETGSLLHVHTKEFTFDTYGNTVQVLDSASGAETIQTLATYETITSQNILNRKIEEKTIYNPTNQNVLISWKKMGYTGNVMTSEEKYVENTGWLITRLAHDIYGNVVTITDPRGSGPGDPMYTTQITYDNDYHALRVQMVNPLGHGEKIRYDRLKINIAEEEDANGNVQRKEYDVFGRLRQIIEPGDSWTKEIIFVSEGNPQAQFMEVRYADNSGTGFRFERSYYDGLDRIYKEEKKGYTEINGGNSTTYLIESRFDFFDETKKLSRQSKPFIAGKQTPVYDSIIYDNYARPVQQQTSDGYTIDFSYNASCPVNTACQLKIDAEGYVYKIITDARNRVIRREDPEGGLVITEFLPLQEKFYDAGGLVTTMNYDTAGRNTSMLDRNSGLWVYLRDNAGNIIMQVAPDGKRIANTYDALNRLLVKSYPGNTTGETNVTFQYDDSNVANGKGRVTRVIDASGETLFGYDAKGNIASWARVMPNISGSGNITVAFKADYDQQKRIKKLTYPDGSAVSQLYADAGYLRQVRLVSPGGFFGAPVVTYEGPDLGQKFVRKTGNNVTELIGYDPATHRPTSLETVLPNAVSLRKQRYDYDGNGNTLAITDILNDGARTETFTYDGLNRISSAVGAYGSKSYIHDARGRLIVEDNAAQSFGDASHPEAVTNSTEGPYAYDLNGNMMNRLARQYIYDSENRLKEIKQGTATKQNFIYDFSGLRAIKAREDGTKTYYFGGLKNYGALYEITLPPGSSTPQHTKYIYGINSDRAAQVTVPNASLVAINASAQDTLAGMQSWGSASGIAMKINHTLNGYVIGFVTAGKHWKIFALVVTSVLFLLITFSTLRTRCENRHWRQHKPVFFSAPVILAVFTLFYGIGCASTPTTPSDILPGSGDVSSAPVVGSLGGDTTMKGLPATGTFFFHYNHVGSLNYITNTAGQVVSEYSYLPYGEIDLGRSSGPDIARYKFATYERDEESGLDNANARMYSPQTGKFTSPDTVIPGDGQRSMGFNRYAYAEGMPTKYSDPSGHFIDPVTVAVAYFGGKAHMPTIPWHSYTGPSKREGCGKYDCEPATSLDSIALDHDRDYDGTSKEGSKTIILGAFANSTADKLVSIKADARFIGAFLAKTFSGFLFAENSYLGLKAGDGFNWYGIVLGMFYSVTDLTYGTIGTVLFALNIVINITVQMVEQAPETVVGWAVCGFFCGAVAAFFDWW